MGIDTAFRRLLAAKAGDQIFGSSVVSCTAGVPVVSVRDLLTDLYRAMTLPSRHGGKMEHLFTGDQLVDLIVSLALKDFQASAPLISVLCVDNQALVPPEKGREQKRRDQDRDHEVPPYPDDATFHVEGIKYGPRHLNAPVRFDIRGVMSNRYLRRTLWVFVVSRLRERHSEMIPPGVNILWDHFDEGVYTFTQAKCDLTTRYTNQFGEADLKLAYWVNQFTQAGRRVEVVVHSIDSDVWLILTHLVAHRRLKQKPIESRVLLRYWKQMWVDVTKFECFLREKLKLTSAHLMAVCVLGGTDYVDKTLCFSGFSAETLFEWLSTRSTDLEALFADRKFLVRLVRYAYGRKWSMKEEMPPYSELVEASEARTKCAETKKRKTAERTVMFPGKKQLDEAFEMIRFNLQYWSQDWC